MPFTQDFAWAGFAIFALVAGICVWIAIVAGRHLPAWLFLLWFPAVAVPLAYAYRVPQGDYAIKSPGSSISLPAVVPGHDVLWPIAVAGVLLTSAAIWWGGRAFVGRSGPRRATPEMGRLIASLSLLLVGLAVTRYGLQWRDSLSLLDSAWGSPIALAFRFARPG